jgi:transcription elongation GreA/GreB family factor/nitroimidazol reductase NimA-like FMN-containing flavoprotein (pyridoxamine 5'-phosphate oxidase superfamily)
MGGVTVHSSSPARVLRARIRTELEEEYLRLRTVHRPALLQSLADAPTRPSPETAVLEDELTLLDRRIGAIHAFLEAAPVAREKGRPAIGRCVRVDLGDGPCWMLLADLPVLDDRVVASDSPLGRVLLATEVGADFAYATPQGPRMGTLLGVERDDDRPARATAGNEAPPAVGPRPIVPLDRSKSLELLGTRSPGVGRLAFVLFGRPHISVVNFLLDGEELVFRVDPGTKLSAVGYGGHFTMEVDDIDWLARTGWSVTVTGPVQRVRGPEADRLLARLESWAAGERRYVVRLKPRTASGRALLADGRTR